MDHVASPEVVPKPKKRPRIGIRGLLGLVLLAALALGWFAWQDRLARRQTARLAELRQIGVIVNRPFPTPLCWWAMRLMLTDSNTAGDRLARWVDRGWTFTPQGFNANYLAEDKVASVVRRLQVFGRVKEVRYKGTGPPELCLFFIDEVPFNFLGVPPGDVTVTDHPTLGN